MWAILTTLNKHLAVAIPICLTAGFLFGLAAGTSVDSLKLLIVPLTFLMVYPMMVTLNVQHLKKGLDLRLQGAAQFINFGVIPFLAFYLGRLFFAEQPALALGLLLACLLPTSGMTISWTGFAKGNMAAAINMTVIGLTLGSLVTPIYLNALLGATISIDPARVIQQIVLIVFLPMLLGQLTRLALLRRYSLTEFKDRLAPRFPALSTAGVLGIVFVAMALKAGAIMAAPALLLGIIAPLLLIYLLNYSLSTIVGSLFFGRGDAIALVYGTVMRNLSIALAIAMNAFGPQGQQAALVIALAYVIQVQSAAWYIKLSDSFFGKAVAKA